MSARPGPRGGYHVSGIPTAISLTLLGCSGRPETVQKLLSYGSDARPDWEWR